MSYQSIQNKDLIASALKAAAGLCDLLRTDIDDYEVRNNDELEPRLTVIIQALHQAGKLGNSEPRKQ